MSKKNLSKSNKRSVRKEHLTNLYMIQLSLGLLGIVILSLFSNLYKNPKTLIHMQTVTWILFGIFTAVCIVLAIIGKSKKCSCCFNYGLLSGICALITLWLSLFNKIRVILENVVRSVTGNEMLSIGSFWNIRVPIILIIAYLVIAFIVYCVMIAKKD